MGQGEGLGETVELAIPKGVSWLQIISFVSSKGFRVSLVSLPMFRPPLLSNIILCFRDYEKYAYTPKKIQVTQSVVLTRQFKPHLPWPTTFWKHIGFLFPNLPTTE